MYPGPSLRQFLLDLGGLPGSMRQGPEAEASPSGEINTYTYKTKCTKCEEAGCPAVKKWGG